MKSKNVKIPLELVEIIDKRTNGRTPGEALLEIVLDYVALEDYARSLKLKLTGKESVSEIMIRYYEEQGTNIAEIRESLNELKTMVRGLEIYYKKFGK